MPRQKEPTHITVNKPFPKVLRELMQETNTTQPMLADSIGVTRQTISLYSIGQSTPDIDIFIKIADYFNVSFDYLLGRSVAKHRENIDINNKIGLSETAIETLEDCYERDKANSITRTINALLENRYTLGAISRYLYYNLNIEENEGKNVYYNSIYKYIDECGVSKDGILWGEMKAPIDFSFAPEAIDNEMYKRMLLIKVQEQLQEMSKIENEKNEIK